MEALILVIEGCDLSGKSTLAAIVESYTRALLIHTTPPDVGETDYDRTMAIWQAQGRRNDIVWDRAIFSNIVYYPLLHRGNPNTEVHLSKWVSTLIETQSLVVHAYASVETLVRRYHWRMDEYEEINPHTLPGIVAAYRALMLRLTSMGVRVVDFDSDNMTASEFYERYERKIVQAVNPLRGSHA